MTDRRALLPLLWVFVMFNYLYCDILGLMDPHLLAQYLAGTVSGLQVTPEFLLGASLLMEIPMAMVLVSRLLGRGPNRWANIVAGTLMTAVQVATLFVGASTTYYLFFSAIEITCTAAIVWLAWTWRPQPVAVTGQPAL